MSVHRLRVRMAVPASIWRTVMPATVQMAILDQRFVQLL